MENTPGHNDNENDPASSIAIYRRYLDGHLCWVDGTATHASSDQQRQCPLCRRKWSFDNLRREIQLLDEFCLKQSASRAARELSCSKNTALIHYNTFFRHMEGVVAKLILDEKIALSPITSKELKSLERALTGGREKQRLNACRHLFFISLNAEERINLIFKAVIAPAVKRKRKIATVVKLRSLPSVSAFLPPARPRTNPFSTVPVSCLGMGKKWAKVWLALRRKSASPRK